MKILFTLLLCLFISGGLFAQGFHFDDDLELLGDAAVAEKYLLWAEDAIAAGNWEQARAALERAADFADVSSDISYLLAIARNHEDERRGLVLQPLEKAIVVNRWKQFTEANARLLEADQLITLRRYATALQSLARYKTIAGEDADYAYLRLAALKGLSSTVEFRRRMVETMDSYPRDPRPLRLLFHYARYRKLDRDDVALLEIALRRLPFLIDQDPELAWMAAQFIKNDDDAGRLVAAYRAGTSAPHPASLVPALNLGLIDDIHAVDELFEGNILEKEIIVNVSKLLRSDEGRDYMIAKLHSFTGAITDDEDQDGYPESRAIYYQGGLQEYYYDATQDGITDLYISFITGTPQRAEIIVQPVSGDEMIEAFIWWENYPSVLRASLGDETYFPIPGRFPFSPIVFTEIGVSANYAGLIFPQRNHRGQGVNRRTLVSFSASIQRPANLRFGMEFNGGIEHIYLERGIPRRAEVTLDGNIVSVTEFENGFPVIQRLDMDLDGRMETVRRFRRTGNRTALEAVEHDRFGSGIFGSAEVYRANGTVVYSWDMDGDAIRETRVER